MPKVVAAHPAKHNYEASSDQEISLTKGGRVDVHEKHDSGWWKGEHNGKTGWFPSNYLNMKKDLLEDGGDKAVSFDSSAQDNKSSEKKSVPRKSDASWGSFGDGGFSDDAFEFTGFDEPGAKKTASAKKTTPSGGKNSFSDVDFAGGDDFFGGGSGSSKEAKKEADELKNTKPAVTPKREVKTESNGHTKKPDEKKSEEKKSEEKKSEEKKSEEKKSEEKRAEGSGSKESSNAKASELMTPKRESITAATTPKSQEKRPSMSSESGMPSGRRHSSVASVSPANESSPTVSSRRRSTPASVPVSSGASPTNAQMATPELAAGAKKLEEGRRASGAAIAEEKRRPSTTGTAERKSSIPHEDMPASPAARRSVVGESSPKETERRDSRASVVSRKGSVDESVVGAQARRVSTAEIKTSAAVKSMELASLDNLVGARRAELEDVQKKIASETSKLKTVQEDIRIASRDLQEMDDRLKQGLQELDMLGKMRDKQLAAAAGRSPSEELTMQLEKMEAELRIVKESRDRLHNELTSVRQSRDKMNRVVDETVEANRALSSNLEDIQRRKSIVVQGGDKETESRLNEMQAQLREKHDKIMYLENVLAERGEGDLDSGDLSRQLQSMQVELAQRDARIEDFERQLAGDLGVIYDEMKEQQELLLQVVDKKTKLEYELKTELAEVYEQINRESDEKKRLLAEVEQAHKEIREYAARYVSAKDEADAIRMEKTSTGARRASLSPAPQQSETRIGAGVPTRQAESVSKLMNDNERLIKEVEVLKSMVAVNRASLGKNLAPSVELHHCVVYVLGSAGYLAYDDENILHDMEGLRRGLEQMLGAYKEYKEANRTYSQLLNELRSKMDLEVKLRGSLEKKIKKLKEQRSLLRAPVARALNKYLAREERELSFEEDDLIFILRDDFDGWCQGACVTRSGDLKTGWLPRSFIEKTHPGVASKLEIESLGEVLENSTERMMSSLGEERDVDPAHASESTLSLEVENRKLKEKLAEYVDYCKKQREELRDARTTLQSMQTIMHQRSKANPRGPPPVHHEDTIGSDPLDSSLHRNMAGTTPLRPNSRTYVP